MYKHFNKKRMNDRDIDELIGMSRGVIADGNVNQAEAEFLYSWMQNNIDSSANPMVNQLYCRIKGMLADNILDQDEEKELFSILEEFTGKSAIDNSELITSTLPLCIPKPPVVFQGNGFCFTGKFAYGPRKICEGATEERGGIAKSGVSNLVKYLVIGSFCTDSWIHTSYGRKIEKAVDIRAKNKNLSIISEDHWAECAFRM